MNSWADTCPTQAGYDELGNFMTYTWPVCIAAVGHNTREQAERMHYLTSEMNPVLYAWGQYNAISAQRLWTTLPPPSPPTPADALRAYNPCRVSDCHTRTPHVCIAQACTCMQVRTCVRSRAHIRFAW